MSDRFELEQEILKCWTLTDDVKRFVQGGASSDDMTALANVYDIHFNRLWKLFSDMAQQGKIQ